MSDEQPRLFDPERYASTRIDAVLRLPSGSAQAFWVASILGRFLRLEGDSQRLRSAKDSAGSLITPRRRPVVLATLEISERHWRRLVDDWQRRNIAHICGPATVFLFAHALLEECPACHQYIDVVELPPTPRKPRGPGWGGRNASVQAAQKRPVTGTKASASAAHKRPPTGTDATHTSKGVLRRDSSRDGGSDLGFQRSDLAFLTSRDRENPGIGGAE